jgi:hypothetical protein
LPTAAEQIDAWRAAKSETEHLEFKEAKNQFDFDTLADYCIAIANERGGNLLLGIANKPPRPVVGTTAYLDTGKVSEDLFRALHFRVDVEEVQHPDGRVLVFHIPSRPARHPYERKGQYLMRIGESLVPMTTEQLERILKEDVPRYTTAISISRKRGVFIAGCLMLLIGFILFLYWGALHRPRQRDVEVQLPSENHPTTDRLNVTVQRNWRNKLNWREHLRVGMTRTKVRKLFGEPEMMDVVSDLETWEYGSGKIQFVVDSSNPDGALHAWFEPQ